MEVRKFYGTMGLAKHEMSLSVEAVVSQTCPEATVSARERVRCNYSSRIKEGF